MPADLEAVNKEQGWNEFIRQMLIRLHQNQVRKRKPLFQNIWSFPETTIRIVTVMNLHRCFACYHTKESFDVFYVWLFKIEIHLLCTSFYILSFHFHFWFKEINNTAVITITDCKFYNFDAQSRFPVQTSRPCFERCLWRPEFLKCWRDWKLRSAPSSSSSPTPTPSSSVSRWRTRTCSTSSKKYIRIRLNLTIKADSTWPRTLNRFASPCLRSISVNYDLEVLSCLVNQQNCLLCRGSFMVLYISFRIIYFSYNSNFYNGNDEKEGWWGYPERPGTFLC